MTKWIEKEKYWLSSNEQGTDAWKEDRHRRITGSVTGSAVGNSSFCDVDKAARIIAGLEEQKFSEQSIQNMAHGTKEEPNARDWYCKSNNVEVVERGLAVPKWNPYLGASVDGDVVGTGGIIEIKAPKRMYGPLKKYIQDVNNGWKPPPYYRNHIWKTHYDQMQMCMKVLDKQWCDYIVYCTPENQVFTQRIEFNTEYWNNFLYPAICNFIEEKLKPLIHELPALPENYINTYD